MKAHIVKNCGGHIALDGVDSTYFNYLDLLFRELEKRYGLRLRHPDLTQFEAGTFLGEAASARDLEAGMNYMKAASADQGTVTPIDAQG